MVEFNNKICVTGSELISLMGKNTYSSMQQRNQLNVVRRACRGTPALIELSSIPFGWRELVKRVSGTDVENKPSAFADKIVVDSAAVTYFGKYLLNDGSFLPPETQREYSANASVLNAVKKVYEDAKDGRRKIGKSMHKFWQEAIEAVNAVRKEQGHTLPTTEITLKRKYQNYVTNGYSALISGKFGNDNSRKVSDKIENLLMSLYTMPDKPFAATVHQLYLQFVTGSIQVACNKTGELLNAADYCDENGEPTLISEATVWNYLNQAANRAVVDRKRMGAKRYNDIHRPHHHRHAPVFAFSKVSLDDRDLPRKCNNGKWVKAYYAYDVTSGCVVGYAHSLYKNEELFLDCLRDMFRLIEREGFGIPKEVEVENHLVNQFFDDLAMMFPYVRICNPGNSQEKRAEHFNRAKKYGVEMKTQTGIGRWWSKHEAYTVDRDKKGDDFVEKNQLPYERLVADDVQSIRDYNNQLHPKQKKYPGKTRWQVLVENMNEDSVKPNKSLVYKCIGYHTQTSIRRNHYATVLGAKYQISSFAVLDKLQPGNYTVDAYYLPDGDGMIQEVYLYQNNKYVCTADKILTYNESKAEATAIDFENYKKQSAVVAEFDSETKGAKNELTGAVIIKSDTLKEVMSAPVELVKEEAKEEAVSFDDLIEEAGSSDTDAVDSL